MPVKYLSERERQLLETDALLLLNELRSFHRTWCEDPAEGSRYIACYRIMKLDAALEALIDELGPFT